MGLLNQEDCRSADLIDRHDKKENHPLFAARWLLLNKSYRLDLQIFLMAMWWKLAPFSSCHFQSMQSSRALSQLQYSSKWFYVRYACALLTHCPIVCPPSGDKRLSIFSSSSDLFPNFAFSAFEWLLLRPIELIFRAWMLSLIVPEGLRERGCLERETGFLMCLKCGGEAISMDLMWMVLRRARGEAGCTGSVRQRERLLKLRSDRSSRRCESSIRRSSLFSLVLAFSIEKSERLPARRSLEVGLGPVRQRPSILGSSPIEQRLVNSLIRACSFITNKLHQQQPAITGQATLI